jgi:hypothetical protein
MCHFHVGQCSPCSLLPFAFEFELSPVSLFAGGAFSWGEVILKVLLEDDRSIGGFDFTRRMLDGHYETRRLQKRFYLVVGAVLYIHGLCNLPFMFKADFPDQD